MASVYGGLPVPAATGSYSHAVCRSAELLSCAKTAVKIAQSRHAKQEQVQQQQQENGATGSASEQQQWFSHLNPADLELHNPALWQRHPSSEVLEDGLTLLRTMESELKHLEGLVRRRGHTNDPTQEISAAVLALEQDAAELTGIVQTMVPVEHRGGGNHNSQRQRHWKAVQQWFQSIAQRHAAKLKEILAVRGTVLAEQARRRQRFQTTTTTNGNTNKATTTAQSAAVNALFARPPPKPKAVVLPPSPPGVFTFPAAPHSAVETPEEQTPMQQQLPSSHPAAAAAAQGPPLAPLATAPTAVTNGGVHSAPPTAAASNPFAAYNNHHHRPPPAATTVPTVRSGGYSYYSSSGAGGGGYGGVQAAGYGGSASNTSYYTGHHHQHAVTDTGTGIRQRRSDNTSTNTTAGAAQQHQQLAMRQQERQTASRVNEAKQAEKSLAALGTVFGKMSTLIAQQSETLEKVEDDVEAACLDVAAGHAEITTLYSIKKGNRMLILKVFGLLIFLIVFMRFYAKR
jgi:hypothetical protein